MFTDIYVYSIKLELDDESYRELYNLDLDGKFGHWFIVLIYDNNKFITEIINSIPITHRIIKYRFEKINDKDILRINNAKLLYKSKCNRSLNEIYDIVNNNILNDKKYDFIINNCQKWCINIIDSLRLSHDLSTCEILLPSCLEFIKNDSKFRDMIMNLVNIYTRSYDDMIKDYTINFLLNC
jgi:hypothetical protein